MCFSFLVYGLLLMADIIRRLAIIRSLFGSEFVQIVGGFRQFILQINQVLYPQWPADRQLPDLCDMA